MTPVRTSDGVITNGADLSAADVAHKKVICPACGVFVFQMWPEGWDAHAAHRCAGLCATPVDDRKREFRSRFSHLFRSPRVANPSTELTSAAQEPRQP